MSRDHITRNEIRKDQVQSSVEATIDTVGQVGGIVLGAVRDVARSVGGLGSELFEIRESARRARAEHGHAEGEDAGNTPRTDGDTDDAPGSGEGQPDP